MRSNEVTAPMILGKRPTPSGPRNAIDRLHHHDRLESIARLRSAVLALDQVDVSGWDDSALTDHLDEISESLVAIDAQLSRVANAVRARGYSISEPMAA